MCQYRLTSPDQMRALRDDDDDDVRDGHFRIVLDLTVWSSTSHLRTHMQRTCTLLRDQIWDSPFSTRAGWPNRLKRVSNSAYGIGWIESHRPTFAKKVGRLVIPTTQSAFRFGVSRRFPTMFCKRFSIVSGVPWPILRSQRRIARGVWVAICNDSHRSRRL